MMSGELSEVDVEELEKLTSKDEEELSDKEVTSKIRLSVKRRFDYPSWVVVFEFENRDGKRADCLALNTTASRNFTLAGFEFKASRSDWLAEKRDHQKADLFVQMCDEWYVVAGRRGIVDEAELPDGWGLLELKPSGQLWKLEESDLNDLQDTSLDRRFYARFMRKAVGSDSNYSYADIKEARRRGYQEAKDKAIDEHLDYNQEQLRKKAESYEKLRDSGLYLSFELGDERIQRLKRAEDLIEKIDEEDYGSLESDIDHLRRSIWRRTSDMAETCMELEDALESVRAGLNGGDD